MAKKASSILKNKYWYIQSWGTYTSDTPVFVGYSIKEITKIIKRQKKWNQQIVEKWCDDHEDSENVFTGKNGGVWSYEGWTLLYLPDWKNDWEHIDTLIHECFHLVIAQLGKSKLFINNDLIEEEGMAYQLEFLVRSIRRQLDKTFHV